MARPRVQLQSLLESLTEHVYFQSPNNLVIEYPCIIYARDSARTDFADDLPYRTEKRYLVTVIDRDPDSPIPDLVAALQTSAFNRAFVADSLYHTVYTLYF